MQKKLIALAVAGLVSGGAFAQSNVTISGLIDMGYSHASGNGKSVSAINQGLNDGSRLIFKGTEGLGNGISAIFMLEYGLAPDINSGIGDSKTAGLRQSHVGLTGNFGTVLAGRLKGPGDFIMAGMDSTDQSNSFSALLPMAYGNMGPVGTTMSNTLSNTVAYVTPAMGGFTFVGAYSFAGASEQDNMIKNDPERVMGFRVSYEMGPLALAYAHHRVNDFGSVADLDQREHMYGATYDFGAAKGFVTYQTVKDNASGVEIFNGTTWSLGATIPVGKDLVRAQYARSNPDGGNNNAASFGIRYDHVLSKRTWAYIGYNRVTNDDGAAAVTYVGNTGNSGLSAIGQNNSGYGFGIEHTF